MAIKKAGFYQEDPISGSAFQLFIELDDQELMCMSKSIESGLVVAFELFSLEKDANEDWNDIFYEIKTISKLFNQTFKQVTCYFNTVEAVLVPEKYLTATSAEDYLNLIYGESNRMEVKYEKLSSTKVFINAYRIRKSLSELLSRQFIIFQTAHVYSSLLNDIMSRDIVQEQFVKIQCYTQHFILAIWKGGRLQMVQTFKFITAEDAMYFVLRATQQFAIDPTAAVLEFSGMLDMEADLYKQLKNLYTHFELDLLQPTGIFSTVLLEYPNYYFTPFYKLSV
ncbi:MAG: DUF3822 family protein [Sphingobacteriia bacterium]|nr:MAG: DUF3822 family protein [Sphingobacteriia bacterium]TAG32042.1 MAG: DUF3822 family protein [Sphingobacteriia bacterium]